MNKGSVFAIALDEREINCINEMRDLLSDLIDFTNDMKEVEVVTICKSLDKDYRHNWQISELQSLRSELAKFWN